ncbi:hypothetical protein GQ600_21820 [Phytophthora cactorum]|nr:hypothetical protein GQ600_21820 [Phytophthora cactorum]
MKQCTVGQQSALGYRFRVIRVAIDLDLQNDTSGSWLYYAVAHLLPQSGKCETCVRVTDSDTKNQKIIPSLRYQQRGRKTSSTWCKGGRCQQGDVDSVDAGCEARTQA